MNRSPSLGSHLPLVAAIMVVTIASGAYEIVPASTTPILAANLGVPPTQITWLVTVMLGVAVLASVPSGVFVDRFGVETSFVVAAVVFFVAGVASWWFASRGSFWLLFWARFLAGVGFVLVWNAGLNVFGRFENAATATGLFTAGGPAGFAVGHVTGPLIATWFDWPLVFLGYPLLLGVATLGVIAWWSDDLESTSTGELPAVSDLLAVLGNRTVGLLCLLAFVAYSLYLFINSWAPTYLATEFSLSLAASGVVTALFPLLGAASRLSGGVVTDRVFGGRTRPVVVVSLVASALSLAGIMISESYLLLAASLIVGGYFVQLSLGLFYSVLPATVAGEHVTTAVAVLTSVGLFGAFSAPAVTGYVIQATGGYGAAFGYALFLTGVGLVAAVLFFEH